MGMSASQARYLSLTARKSDLEFRGQQINQSRLMLSNQSANLYSSMLSMSVPTPPVETDFMKDVYSFSMGGDNTTLSSYKLSMGKDGYGYDILYSKPATSRQLAASSSSNVQRVINRQAANETSSQFPLKIKTTYDNSKPQSKSSPNVSKLISITSTTPKYKDRGNSPLSSSSPQHHATQADVQSNYTSMYNKIHGKKVTEVTKPSINSTMSSPSVAKMTKKDDNTITYNYGTKDSRTLHKLSEVNVCDIFGGSYNDSDHTFTYTNSLLSKILEGFGDSNGNVTVGVSGGKQKGKQNPAGKGNVSFYIDAENMKFYVMKAQDGSDSETGANMFDSNSINAKTSVYEYDLVALFGLSGATNVKVDTTGDNNPEDKTVYYNNYGTDSKTVRDYYIFGWDDNDGFYFQTTTNLNKDGWKIDDNALVSITPEDFGITANKPQDGTSSQSNKAYQYFRDSSNGDIWELCTTTNTNGEISESWKLFQANKTYNIGEKEAQLIDEKDWPSGINHTQQNGEYDCYYVPDKTGTGGSYYLIAKKNITYSTQDPSDGISSTNSDVHKYDANNTYKIEGMTACVVSDNSVPSTIAEAYDLDNYIIYATYNDSDTDFSNPIKYYVYPKDEDSADAVCSYAFEKSYTGKNQILEGRANILVDENGRLSKLDIQGEGTYTLEYGQEKDEEAYNEAYREYEYKLEKYEKEMADIDARTAMIQQQDKKLELQLKSIDTEHSAIQTELEALKKVIDNNIKSGFGTFGG